MPSEMRMEECGLHAHFDAQAATSSGATWGSAEPKMTHLRPYCKTGALTLQKGVCLMLVPSYLQCVPNFLSLGTGHSGQRSLHHCSTSRTATGHLQEQLQTTDR